MDEFFTLGSVLTFINYCPDTFNTDSAVWINANFRQAVLHVTEKMQFYSTYSSFCLMGTIIVHTYGDGQFKDSI